MMITNQTFNNMQKEFIKVIDDNLSVADLASSLLPYQELPLLCKYFNAKYYFRHKDLAKAAELITEVLLGLDQNGKESEFILFFFKFLK